MTKENWFLMKSAIAIAEKVQLYSVGILIYISAYTIHTYAYTQYKHIQ